jgi:endoglucanase
LIDPNWGWGDDVDWYAATQYAGDRILNEANPNLLIIIEGINWIGLPINGLPHGRPTLMGAQYLSHTLMKSNKMVYSAHFYGYTGPNSTGAVGIGATDDPLYRDLTVPELDAAITTEAAYVAENDSMHYTRPVWVRAICHI